MAGSLQWAAAMLKPSSTTTTLCVALLLLGPIACKHDDGRGATEPSAHAEASSPDHADGASAVAVSNDDDRYDATSVARTGIQLDPNLITACHVSDDEAFFAFDSTAVSSPAHDVLAQVAECVTNGPLHGKELELVGYTDPRGTDEYNKELGLMRAESVAKCLRDHGVKLTQIEINSMGEKQASDDTSEWPSDRRVDIRVKADVSASR
jgi:outer membrane protein OmpA-like peptidoglycan-associated protein